MWLMMDEDGEDNGEEEEERRWRLGNWELGIGRDKPYHGASLGLLEAQGHIHATAWLLPYDERFCCACIS